MSIDEDEMRPRYARVLELADRLTEPGKPGSALSASEFHELANGVHDLVEASISRKLRDPCCDLFKSAVQNALIMRDKKKHAWRVDGPDTPIAFCPWCGSARGPKKP